jgi:hypothetical protein
MPTRDRDNGNAADENKGGTAIEDAFLVKWGHPRTDARQRYRHTALEFIRSRDDC